MALDDDSWLIEVCADAGSAFALELGAGGRLHREVSDYQAIEVFDTRWFGRALTLDGYLMVAERDNFIYHEMLAHPALFSHPAPRRVLIVGGGDCGTLREVCKHPEVEQVTQVDIDERVTRVAEQFLPELCTANTDPRARLVFDDGIRWVRESDPGSLDVILVDSTDPVGPAAGLFTADFYRDCRRALAEGGLLVQQSESPLAHLGTILAPMHEALAEAGFGGPATFHFPQPIYPTGWWSVTAAGRDGPVTFARAGAAGDPGFPTEYYTAAIHHAAQALPAFVARALPGRE